MATITSLTTPNSSPGIGSIIIAICSFARAATVTAYADGDVISDDAAGTAKCMEFAVGKSGRVESVHVGYEETDAVNLELWLFDDEPTNFLDNAPLALVSADLPKIVARYNLPDLTKRTAGTGINSYVPVGPVLADLPAQAAPFVTATGKLYGLLVTRSAFTPVSAALVHVKLGVIAG